jgi:hypothetical protein
LEAWYVMLLTWRARGGECAVLWARHAQKRWARNEASGGVYRGGEREHGKGKIVSAYANFSYIKERVCLEEKKRGAYANFN